MLEANCKCEKSKIDQKSVSNGFLEKLEKNKELKQKYKTQVETLDKLKEQYQKMLEANCHCRKQKRLKVSKSEGLNNGKHEQDC